MTECIYGSSKDCNLTIYDTYQIMFLSSAVNPIEHGQTSIAVVADHTTSCECLASCMTKQHD